MAVGVVEGRPEPTLNEGCLAVMAVMAVQSVQVVHQVASVLQGVQVPVLCLWMPRTPAWRPPLRWLLDLLVYHMVVVLVEGMLVVVVVCRTRYRQLVSPTRGGGMNLLTHTYTVSLMNTQDSMGPLVCLANAMVWMMCLVMLRGMGR